MSNQASQIVEPFPEYVRLLLLLHHLIAEGKGEGDEAEEVRDQMDGPWRHLNQEQLALVNGLSADLYTIGVNRPLSRAASAEVLWKQWKQVTRAVEQHDWRTALDALRECESYIGPGSVAGIRAACWASLEQFDVAIEFLKEEARLQPLDSEEENLLLICLLRTDRFADADTRVGKLAADETNPRLLLTAAQVLSLRATQLGSEAAPPVRRRAIELAERGLKLAASDAAEQIAKNDHIAAYLHLASNYEALGDGQNALRACEAALKLDPNNSDALVLHGWLRHEIEPEDARKEFREGFLHRLPQSIQVPMPTASFAVHE